MKLLANGSIRSQLIEELAKPLKISVQGVHFILSPLIKDGMVKRFGGRKTGKFGTAK